MFSFSLYVGMMTIESDMVILLLRRNARAVRTCSLCKGKKLFWTVSGEVSADISAGVRHSRGERSGGGRHYMNVKMIGNIKKNASITTPI